MVRASAVPPCPAGEAVDLLAVLLRGLRGAAAAMVSPPLVPRSRRPASSAGGCDVVSCHPKPARCCRPQKCRAGPGPRHRLPWRRTRLPSRCHRGSPSLCAPAICSPPGCLARVCRAINAVWFAPYAFGPDSDHRIRRSTCRRGGARARAQARARARACGSCVGISRAVGAGLFPRRLWPLDIFGTGHEWACQARVLARAPLIFLTVPPVDTLAPRASLACFSCCSGHHFGHLVVDLPSRNMLLDHVVPGEPRSVRPQRPRRSPPRQPPCPLAVAARAHAVRCEVLLLHPALPATHGPRLPQAGAGWACARGGGPRRRAAPVTPHSHPPTPPLEQSARSRAPQSPLSPHACVSPHELFRALAVLPLANAYSPEQQGRNRHSFLGRNVRQHPKGQGINASYRPPTSRPPPCVCRRLSVALSSVLFIPPP